VGSNPTLSENKKEIIAFLRNKKKIIANTRFAF